MRVLVRVLTAIVLAGLHAPPARAQAADYPRRPVTVVVPFPAGSATDAAARKVAEGLQRRLGESFVVENRAGADGTIAARYVARAAPDGYTLFVTTSTTQAANPSLYRQLPYDPVKDFAPIGGIIRIPFMLGVRPDFPARDLAEFVRAAAAAKPPLSYASANAGSQAAAELLRSTYGFELVHVPYRGSPQALTDLIAGRVDVFFSDPAAGLGLLASEKFRVLGVTGPKRLPTLASIPTLAEQGAGDFNVVSWVAAFAPAGTPDAIVHRLNETLNAVLRERDAIEFAQRNGAEILATAPDELARFVAEDAKRWEELVRIAKIEPK